MQALTDKFEKIMSLIRQGKGAPKTGLARKQLFLNYKGGTGKTSISAAYGYYLAMTGRKVLMIDLDAQGHLTTCFNQEMTPHEKSLYSIMVKGGRLSEIITDTSLPNLKIAPSSIAISAMELPLYRMSLREFKLRKALKDVERNFDYIIMDSAPNIGLLSLNAILSCDDILVPLLADFLSFHGLKVLMETLKSIEKDFKVPMPRIRIFLNRYNPGYEICKQCHDAIHKYYPEYSLKACINESHEIMDATSVGKSIFELDPNSNPAKDIRDLVVEVNNLQ